MEEKTPDLASQEEQYKRLHAQAKKTKKKILVTAIVLVAVLLLIFGVVKILELFSKKQPGVPDGTYSFYPAYEGDIMENTEYLGLNRTVHFCRDPLGYGLTESIHEGNRKDFDPEVLFLNDWIQTIIAGDAVAYNASFNATFWKDNEKKSDFSQQMLHNILITYQSTEAQENGEKLVTYKLEYMIHRNDGSFRRDIGSDMIRPQFVTLRIYADGSMAIEKIVTLYNEQA